MNPFIDIGSTRIPSFGVLLFVGWIAVLVALARQSRVHGLSYALLYRTTLVAFVCALAGSRLLFVVFVEPPSSIAGLFDAAQGTMYYGFLVGAATGSFLYLRALRADVLSVLDACIPAWLLLQIAGRIGCHLAGCCFGRACDLPWSVTFTDPMSQATRNVGLHPSQLYEAIGVASILVILLALEHRTTKRGVITFAYLLMYPVLRFLVEIVRADDRGVIADGALSISQAISLLIFPAAAIALWNLREKRRGEALISRSRWRQS